MMRSTSNTWSRHRPSLSFWLWAVVVLIFIGAILLASYVLYSEARNRAVSQKVVALNDPPPLPTPLPGAVETPQADLPQWTGSERVNVLLMGIDEREKEDGPWRTDTMIVLTIDPVSQSAGMLSIPRDLWVPIYAYDIQSKINNAHYYGDAYDYPGGGPALARDTVQYNLGVPIHFYARLNFAAFERLVDEIGGIDIYVPETIDDPHYPDELHGYDPFYIEAGEHHLDGKTALKYARTRATFGADFDRARRQQDVILAVRDQVVNLNQLPRLVSKAPTLLDTLGDAIVTDMTLNQAIKLARLAVEIDLDNIQTAVIDPNHTVPYTTDDELEVLVPDREKMRELRDRIFAAPQNTYAGATTEERLAEEGARVVILNGTQTPGLAGQTQDYLNGLGFQVVEIGDAPTLYDNTLILDYTGKPFTAKQIAQQLGLRSSAITPASSPEGEFDIKLILGSNFELPDG